MNDVIGYIGSVVVLVSFMMKDMTKLRWTNIAGCSIFIVYGVLLGSFPIILTNSAIVLVNFYYLFRKE